MPIIQLSDGSEFEVRTLGLFELDDVLPDLLGPFTYPMTMFGKTFDAEYDIGRYEKLGIPIPEKPDMPESQIQEYTPEWDQLMDWKLYQAAELHEKRRLEVIVEYYNEIKEYILKKACVDDPNRIQTLVDWENVYDVALVPQLTMELIVKTLNNTYSAKFNGQNVMDALKDTKKGRGSYNTIKLWENKLMIELNKSEIEYAMIPLNERARKVCAMFLDDIMSYLEIDFERKISGGNKTGTKNPTP